MVIVQRVVIVVIVAVVVVVVLVSTNKPQMLNANASCTTPVGTVG